MWLTLQVEDIVDTGRTLKRLIAMMQEGGAASVKVASLLSKPARRVETIEVDYLGFECPDEVCQSDTPAQVPYDSRG